MFNDMWIPDCGRVPVIVKWVEVVPRLIGNGKGEEGEFETLKRSIRKDWNLDRKPKAGKKSRSERVARQEKMDFTERNESGRNSRTSAGASEESTVTRRIGPSLPQTSTRYHDAMKHFDNLTVPKIRGKNSLEHATSLLGGR
jgi:hypothetical protein